MNMRTQNEIFRDSAVEQWQAYIQQQIDALRAFSDALSDVRTEQDFVTAYQRLYTSGATELVDSASVRVHDVDVGVDRLREAFYFAQTSHDPDVGEDEVLRVPMV